MKASIKLGEILTNFDGKLRKLFELLTAYKCDEWCWQCTVHIIKTRSLDEGAAWKRSSKEQEKRWLYPFWMLLKFYEQGGPAVGMWGNVRMASNCSLPGSLLEASVWLSPTHPPTLRLTPTPRGKTKPKSISNSFNNCLGQFVVFAIKRTYQKSAYKQNHFAFTSYWAVISKNIFEKTKNR